jgi:bacterioferritin
MKKGKLIKHLNEDLAGEWGTIMRYTYQSAMAFGLRGAELRDLLQKEIPDELGHASFLTDVIVDLGGDPVLEHKPFKLEHDIKAMLELDLKMELGDVENYKKHARLAEDMGEIELKVKLEEMAADENRHARELRRILRGIERSTK